MRLKTYLAKSVSIIAFVSMNPAIAHADSDANTYADQPVDAESGQNDYGVEELVVTARRTAEPLMSIPLSVSAMSSQKINAMNIKGLDEVSQFTPSFRFISQGNSSGRNDRAFTSMTFRGLYLNANFSLVAGTFLFVDGSPVLGASPPSMSDVEQVEVLKGPQSVYFGRSTFVGAVSYRMREPSNTFKASVSAEYSSYDSNEQTISVEGPVIPDVLAVRVGARHWERGGMYRNAATGGRLGSQSTKSLSGSFVLTPSSDLRIKGFINVQRNVDGSPAQAALKTSEHNCNLGGRSSYYCGKLPDADKLPASIISSYDVIDAFLYQRLIQNSTGKPMSFTPSRNSQFGLRQDIFQASLRADYDTDSGFNFSALAATHSDKKQVIYDLVFRNALNVPNPFTGPDSRPFYSWAGILQDKLKDWSIEGRVSTPQDKPLRLVAGGSYVKLSAPGSYLIEAQPRGVAMGVGVTSRYVNTLAGFGAAYYEALTDLTFSAEARYQTDKVTQRLIYGANGLPATGVTATALKKNFKSFSPRISVDYKYAPNSTVYALWSRGYRPGGFNTNLLTATPDTVAQLAAAGVGLAYDQEKLDNYEIGIKSTWLGGRARTVISLYYDLWRQGQVATPIPIRMPDGQVSTTVSPVGNSGKANMNGIEFEGNIQLSRNLSYSVSFAYNGLKLKDFYCTDCNLVYGNPDGNGHRVPASPKYTASTSAEYTADLTDAFDWYLRGDYSYRSRYFTDFSNVAWVGDSHIANVRIGVRSENVTLEGFVTNLFNDATLTNGQFAADQFTVLTQTASEIRIGLPVKRQFGVRASYKF